MISTVRNRTSENAVLRAPILHLPLPSYQPAVVLRCLEVALHVPDVTAHRLWVADGDQTGHE